MKNCDEENKENKSSNLEKKIFKTDCSAFENHGQLDYRLYVKFRTKDLWEKYMNLLGIMDSTGKEQGFMDIANVFGTLEGHDLMFEPIGQIFDCMTVDSEESFLFIHDHYKSKDFYSEFTNYVFQNIIKENPDDVVMISDLVNYSTNLQGNEIRYYLGGNLSKICNCTADFDTHEIELSRISEILGEEQMDSEQHEKLDEITAGKCPENLMFSERNIDFSKALKNMGFESDDDEYEDDDEEYEDDYDEEECNLQEEMPYPVAKPAEGQHSNWDYLKRQEDNLGFLGGVVQINPNGTEYSFDVLDEYYWEDQFDSEEDMTYITKASKGFRLAKKARKMGEIFRVSEDIFDKNEDRESEIDYGLVRCCGMYEAFRSFAWTLAAYCNEKGITPEQVSINDIEEIAEFVVEQRKRLNYKEDSFCATLCSGDDIHNYYIPDSTPETLRNELVQHMIGETEDEEKDVLAHIMSLDGLRKDMEYLFPAMQTIYDSFVIERNFDEPLEGTVADILYVWCSMTYALRLPILIADGPMNCIWKHPGEMPVLKPLKKVVSQNKKNSDCGYSFTYEQSVSFENENYKFDFPDGFVVKEDVEGRDFIAYLPSKDEPENYSVAPFVIYASEKKSSDINARLKLPVVYHSIFSGFALYMHETIQWNYYRRELPGIILARPESDCLNANAIVAYENTLQMIRFQINVSSKEQANACEELIKSILDRLVPREPVDILDEIDSSNYVNMTLNSDDIKNWENLMNAYSEQIVFSRNYRQDQIVESIQSDNPGISKIKKLFRDMLREHTAAASEYLKKADAIYQLKRTQFSNTKALKKMKKAIDEAFFELLLQFVNLNDERIEIVDEYKAVYEKHNDMDAKQVIEDLLVNYSAELSDTVTDELSGVLVSLKNSSDISAKIDSREKKTVLPDEIRKPFKPEMVKKSDQKDKKEEKEKKEKREKFEKQEKLKNKQREWEEKKAAFEEKKLLELKEFSKNKKNELTAQTRRLKKERDAKIKEINDKLDALSKEWNSKNDRLQSCMIFQLILKKELRKEIEEIKRKISFLELSKNQINSAYEQQRKDEKVRTVKEKEAFENELDLKYAMPLAPVELEKIRKKNEKNRDIIKNIMSCLKKNGELTTSEMKSKNRYLKKLNTRTVSTVARDMVKLEILVEKTEKGKKYYILPEITDKERRKKLDEICPKNLMDSKRNTDCSETKKNKSVEHDDNVEYKVDEGEDLMINVYLDKKVMLELIDIEFETAIEKTIDINVEYIDVVPMSGQVVFKDNENEIKLYTRRMVQLFSDIYTEGIVKDGEMVTDDEEEQNTSLLKLTYGLAVKINQLIANEDLIDQCEKLDFDKEGLYLYFDGEDLAYAFVSGKKRPDLLGIEILGNMAMMRPYLDEQFLQSKLEFMSVEEIEEIANNGDEDALMYLAGIYYEGNDEIEKNPEKAFYWFMKAAENGCSAGIFNIGLFYMRGFGTDKSYEKALEWIEKAKNAGDEDAESLSEHLETIINGQVKAEAGDIETQLQLAQAHMALGNSSDGYDQELEYRKSFEWAEKAANQNSGPAYTILALAFEHGRGVEIDQDKAIEFYKKAAELGDSLAKYNLGIKYMEGNNIEANEKKGFELIQEAANLDYEPAVRAIGKCYQYGYGVEENMKKSIEWYEKSLELNYDPEMEQRIMAFKQLEDICPDSIDDDLENDDDEWDKQSELPKGMEEAMNVDILAKFMGYEDLEVNEVGSIQGSVDFLAEKAKEGDLQAKYTVAKYYIANDENVKLGEQWLKEALEAGYEED